MRRAARIPGGIPKGARGAERRFYELADRYLDDRFRFCPTQASMAGYRPYDDRLEDLSARGVRAQIRWARRRRDDLLAIDPDRLSTAARIDLDLLRNDVECTLFTLRDLRPHVRDPHTYIDLLGHAVLFLTLLEPGSPGWPDRLEALLARLKRVPDLLEAARSNLENPARVLTDFAIETCGGTLSFLETALPPCFESAPRLRAELHRENARAARALRGFRDWLERHLRPRSGGDWRLGRELWMRKLRHTLQSSIEPEVIVRRAEEAIRELRRRMLETAAPIHSRLFPDHRHTGTADDLTDVIVGEVLSRVGERRPVRDTLFEEIHRAVDGIKRFIRARGLVELPPDTDNFRIEATPGFLDGLAVAFFNPPPALEPGMKKSFWVSSVPRGGSPEEDRRLEDSFFREYNHYALLNLAIHEAFPGHYVQFWHALRSPIATVYKKVFASGTFAEGWAVLAEKQMYDAGFEGDDPAALLVHLKQSLRSPINAILDARLHTEPLPEDEADRWALDLMRRVGFQEEAEARGKLRRAKVSSTQLSTYFVGYLELADLLQESRARSGRDFDLPAWNRALLSLGSIPPHHARALMRGTE
ncbi:MAG: DUF885 domain-containing protein [Acidobacteriota bacterium]